MRTRPFVCIHGLRQVCHRLKLVGLVAAYWLAILPFQSARAENDSDRIRRLEQQLESVVRELNELKKRIGEQPSAATGPPTASESAQTARKAAEQAAEAKEKLVAIEKRLDQQGIQARFGEGIFFEDPKGNWSVRVAGRVQLDYRAFSPRQALADTFSLRRARAAVDVTVFKDYRIVVEGEYANGSATGNTAQSAALTLGFVDFGWFAPRARIRLGQFKPAFGYEQTALDFYSDFMERSLGQSLLQNLNYDRGVMVYGAPLPGLWYGATLSNGVGQNLEEKQANAQEVDASKPDFTLRGAANFAQLFNAPDKIVQVGMSYKTGTASNSSSNPYVAASIQTEGRGATFFTPAAFNAAGVDVSNIDRQFLAYEYLISMGPVKLQGENFSVDYSGTRSLPSPAVGFKHKLEANYVSLTWLITGETYADFFKDSTLGKIRPRSQFARGADGGWGALELGLRYSTFDGSDFSNSNPLHTGRIGATLPVTTSTTGAKAITAQLKWIPNIFTRFWLDWVHTDFDSPIVVNGVTESQENALVLRGQIDF